MANSNKQARKIETTKVTLSIIAVLLILATITVGIIGYFSQGFKNWDTENWGDKPGSAASIVDGDGNDLSNPDKVANIALATTATSNNSQIVTATVLPINASNKLVDWTLSYDPVPFLHQTPSEPVTEYVTVTPESDGALTATVRCLKLFHCRIKLTVSSRADASIKKEIPIDYEILYDSAHVSVDVNYKNSDFIVGKKSYKTTLFSTLAVSMTDKIYFKGAKPYAASHIGGSLFPKTLDYDLKIALSEGFKNYLTAGGYSYAECNSYLETLIERDDSTGTISKAVFNMTDESFTLLKLLELIIVNFSESDKTAFINYCLVYSENILDLISSVQIEGVHKNYTVTDKQSFRFADVSANSIELDQTQIVF